MAKFSRIEVVLKMKETGLVPVFYHADIETSKSVVTACYEGGVRVFEFTNRGEAAFDVFKELGAFTKERYPDMILGIGSIVDAATTALYIEAGANFVVSPILNVEMAKICNRRKIAWIPGCATLTEISTAEEAGAEVVKIFPARQVGGPEFISAVKGPCPWTNIMPTGGVKPEESDLREWFNAGAWCVGIGSELIKKEELKSGAYDQIVRRVKEALDIINTINKS